MIIGTREGGENVAHGIPQAHSAKARAFSHNIRLRVATSETLRARLASSSAAIELVGTESGIERKITIASERDEGTTESRVFP